MLNVTLESPVELELEVHTGSEENDRHFCRFECMEDEEIVGVAKCGVLEATEFLVDRYRPLVEHKARAYYLMGADRDDVVQEGMIGLCKAIRDFREERLSKFRPFAELCITRQIITAIKTATRHKHFPLNASISLNQSLGEDGNENSLMDVIPDQSTMVSEDSLLNENPSKDLIEQVRSILSDLEQAVLAGYLAGKTYIEISDELECQTKTIDNALQRAKRKLSSLAHASQSLSHNIDERSSAGLKIPELVLSR